MTLVGFCSPGRDGAAWLMLRPEPNIIWRCVWETCQYFYLVERQWAEIGPWKRVLLISSKRGVNTFKCRARTSNLRLTSFKHMRSGGDGFRWAKAYLHECSWWRQTIDRNPTKISDLTILIMHILTSPLLSKRRNEMHLCISKGWLHLGSNITQRATRFSIITSSPSTLSAICASLVLMERPVKREWIRWFIENDIFVYACAS